MDLSVVTIIQTSSACPEQYEGTLSDGRTFYARYRWGHGRLDIPYGNTVATTLEGEPLDGCFLPGQLSQLFNDAGIRLDESLIQIDRH